MSFPPLAFHVEPERGWLNDPNGLCYFGGKYHAYYQHNPTATVWTAPLSWGHAVSEDLLHWEPAPIALSPDMPYESTGGCFSGSAYVEEGKIWFFYTAVGEDGVQTQCLATSEDGYHLEKYPGNPLLTGGPIDPTGRDFRDPKVFRWSDGSYRMVCGTGYEGRAAVVLYKSQDKLAWEYAGILFETRDMGPVLECPDLYPVEDKWVLCFSRMDQPQRVTFLVGDFDGERFTPESVQHPAVGPNFYAPQSFLDPQGRRLVLGWMTPLGRSGRSRPSAVRLPDGASGSHPGRRRDAVPVPCGGGRQPAAERGSLPAPGGVAVPDHRREEAAAGAPRPGGVGRPGAGGHPHQRGVHQRRGAVLLLLPGARRLPELSENEREKGRPKRGGLFARFSPTLPAFGAGAPPGPGTVLPPGPPSPALPRGTAGRCPTLPPGW